jgi:hypothetical protein
MEAAQTKLRQERTPPHREPPRGRRPPALSYLSQKRDGPPPGRTQTDDLLGVEGARTIGTMRAHITIALALVLAAYASSADAQDTEECIQAYEEAQTLRLDRKLIEAHEKLVICTRATCPAAVTMDCWRWLSEAEDAMPGLSVSVQAESGGDLVDVKVSIDGKELTGDWMGKATRVNPGTHVLRAEAAGYHTSEETVVAREGEKSRVVTLKLRSLTAPVQPVQPTPLAVSTDGGSREVGWPTYVLAGVGIAAIGAGGAVGYLGNKDAADMKDECKPTCPEERVDDARLKLITANVAFGVGGAALVGALISYLVSKPAAPGGDVAAISRRLTFGVDVDPRSRSAGARVRASY